MDGVTEESFEGEMTCVLKCTSLNYRKGEDWGPSPLNLKQGLKILREIF